MPRQGHTSNANDTRVNRVIVLARGECNVAGEPALVGVGIHAAILPLQGNHEVPQRRSGEVDHITARHQIGEAVVSRGIGHSGTNHLPARAVQRHGHISYAT